MTPQQKWEVELVQKLNDAYKGEDRILLYTLALHLTALHEKIETLKKDLETARSNFNQVE